MQKLLESNSIHKFLKIEKYVLLALEAATEQLNLLFAFLSSPQTLDRNVMKNLIPNYSNQAYQMRLIQHRCVQWYCCKVQSKINYVLNIFKQFIEGLIIAQHRAYLNKHIF